MKRTLLATFVLSGLFMLAVGLVASQGNIQRAHAATAGGGERLSNPSVVAPRLPAAKPHNGNQEPELGLVASHTPTTPLAIGDQLQLTMIITNPAQQPLTAFTLTQVLTPEQQLITVTFSPQISGCADLPCTTGTISAHASALVTATYIISGPVGQVITHSSTLSMPALAAPLVFTGTTAAVGPQRVFLPLIRRPYNDPYTQWVKLAQPAGASAVNYLYVNQTHDQCSGPVSEQALPATIFAATNNGIYQLQPATAVDTYGTWVLRSSNTLSASDVISTPFGYFAGGINEGAALRSQDDGLSWTPEALPNENQRIYRLALAGERVLAAGNRGLFVRESNGTWAAEPAMNGVIFRVVADGQKAYAIQNGNEKDTLWRSEAGGAINSWQEVGQLPGEANFMQVIELNNSAEPTLLIGVVRNGIYQLDATGALVPFSSGLDLTVYGLWRDSQQRIYAAVREPGGLLRFSTTGGAGEPLHTLPGQAPSADERLYTVNGNAGGQCNILMTGSREGNVWLRRIP